MNFTSGLHELFDCRSIFVNGELYGVRHAACYETQLTALRTELAERDKRLGAAEGLLQGWLDEELYHQYGVLPQPTIDPRKLRIGTMNFLDPTNPADSSAERLLRSLWSDCLWGARHCEDCLEEQPCRIKIEIESFLAPSNPANDPKTETGCTCFDGFGMVYDITCRAQAHGYRPGYHPKTPLGEKLMALREEAIAKGMRLLSAEEITGKRMVLVSREDLGWALKCTDYGSEEWKDIRPRVEAINRLKAAWEEKP